MDTDARIRRFVPLQRLPKALQDEAVRHAEIRTCEPGELLYDEGHDDEFVYYLLAGTVDLLWHGKISRTVSASHKLALQPLDPPGRRRHGVRAADAVTIALFRRAQLDRLVATADSHSGSELEVAEIAATRSSDWMIRMLQSELFAVLPATNIQKIFALMEQVSLQNDEVVIEQGTPGDYYYVIEQGYCEVSRSIAYGRGHIHLADLGPGAAFGEEALISNKPRNASVTMLSDGLLMRLAKHDFVELILKEVLHPIDFDNARQQVADGAVWLDIRYPEEHDKSAFAGSENIPVNMLRLQSNRLRKDFRYIICGDDVEQCPIAAFLLGERGFEVLYLNETIAAVAAREPQLVATPQRAALPAPAAEDFAFPGTVVSLDQPAQEVPMEGHQDNINPLDNTITRIAALSTRAEAEADMHDTTPVENYADTFTGRQLAEILGELKDQHELLAPSAAPATTQAPTLPEELLSPAVPRTLDAADDIVRDALSVLMQEVEAKLRRHIALEVEAQTQAVAADYRQKLSRMRELTNEEIRQREHKIRQSFSIQYADKEQLLRSYYKKLIALANKISKQKAQLREAKEQFELRMTSFSKLHREVESMRQLMADQIVYMDEQAIDEIPPLAASL